MDSRWKIEGDHGVWLVRGDAQEAALALEGEVLEPEAAAARVDEWFPDGWVDEGTEALAEIVLELEEGFPEAEAPDPEWLKSTLRQALSHGRVTAVRVDEGAPAWGGEREEEEPRSAPRAERQEEKTWIEIRLVDDDDLPVAGERYRIDFADGSAPRYGRLDAQGYAYVAGIPAGSCTVSFPDLDERDWQWQATRAQPMSQGRGA